jgi:hypothetical protein
MPINTKLKKVNVMNDAVVKAFLRSKVQKPNGY